MPHAFLRLPPAVLLAILAVPALCAETPAPPAPLAPPKASADLVVFGDKDAFHGAFKGLDADGRVLWERGDCAAPLQVKTEGMDFIQLGKAPAQTEQAPLLLKLNNGDTLAGRLVSYGAERTVFDTWYAGRLAVPSAMVRAMTPVANAQPPILEGVGKIADWKFSNGYENYLKFSEQEIRAKTGMMLTRPLAYPGKFELETTVVVTQGNNFSLRLFDGKDGFQNNSDSTVMLQVYNHDNGNGNGNGNFYRYSRNNGNRDIGSFQFKSTQGKLALRLLVDTETQTLVLWINGKKAGTFHDQNPFPTGKHLTLGAGGQFRILRLRAAPFSGQLADADGPAAPPAADTLLFANGKDQMGGEITGIADGKISLKTDFGTMEIPLDKVRQVTLSGKHDRQPETGAGAGAVRCFFDPESRVTLRPKAIRGGRIETAGGAFGDHVWDLGAFTRLEFNLDAPFRAKSVPGQDEAEAAEPVEEGAEE